MSRSVIVVGAGVIGLCAAWYARQRGFAVTVIERGPPEHQGCSLGNAGMVTPSHFIPLAAPGMVQLGLRMLLNPAGPFSIRPWANRELAGWAWRFARSATAAQVEAAAPLLRDLGTASRACFEELAQELGEDFGLTQSGLLMLCKEQAMLHHEEQVVRRASAFGMAAEMLTARETQKLEPGLRLDVTGAAYFPDDCYLDPGRFMTALATRAEAAGVRFHWNTAVTGWRCEDRGIRAVVTPAGELESEEVVVAGGAWTAQLLRALGVRLPLQAGKGYSITLPRPPVIPRLGSILLEARVAVTPIGGALRFAGTMEFGGLDLSVNPRRVEGILRAIPRYLPDFGPDHFAGLPVWSGLRPCSPDGLPYVGRSRHCPNLIVAAGHAMLGLSLGPVTGQLVAGLLAGDPPPFDTALLSPDRYG